MDDLISRFATDLTGRLAGPLTFRLILQPAVAMLLAIKDGLADARQGRAAFFWALVSDHNHRREMALRGWAAIAKVFVFAVVLDAVYQALVLRWFYPGEALIVATLLAIVPYLVVRGLVNRLVRLARPSRPGA